MVESAAIFGICLWFSANCVTQSSIYYRTRSAYAGPSALSSGVDQGSARTLLGSRFRIYRSQEITRLRRLIALSRRNNFFGGPGAWVARRLWRGLVGLSAASTTNRRQPARLATVAGTNAARAGAVRSPALWHRQFSEGESTSDATLSLYDRS
jgi:hypothetical protein